MSVKALNWAFEQDASGNDKCVLLALADFANDTGVCWPGQETLAHKARVSVRTIQRIVVRLEQAGLLYREPRFRPDGVRTSDLTVLAVPGHRPPAKMTGGQTDHPSNQADHLTPVSGEPPVEPSGGATPLGVSAGASARVGRTKVNPEHWELAQRVLEVFNDRSERNYRTLKSSGEMSEAAKYVYKRIRDYPDLTYDEHVGIVERTLASRWWGDEQATYNVVYSPNVFEENITRPGIHRRKAAVSGSSKNRPDHAAALRAMRLAKQEAGS